MSTAVRPAKRSPGPWDAFADVDGFVDEVLAELDQLILTHHQCLDGPARNS
jgi:hypothetical protein